MALALFDLDNTLLNGDSDYSWGLFLAEIGAVDAEQQNKKQDEFYQQYLNGTLDILEFLRFQFLPLKQNNLQQLYKWREEYIETIIKPMIASGKPELIEKHRDKNDKLVIITATNDFITRPIADLFGVDTLIATNAEFVDGQYTGNVENTPCFQEGKVTRLKQWLEQNEYSINDSWFYSDSINDLPLLNLVDNPVAVTPDDRLRAHAQEFHWPIID